MTCVDHADVVRTSRCPALCASILPLLYHAPAYRSPSLEAGRNGGSLVPGGRAGKKGK